MKLLDTDFLIDMQRELAADEQGPARRFLEKHPDEEFSVSIISWLEFLEGYETPRDGESFLEPFGKIGVGESIARRGARIRRILRRRGAIIGDFDVLVAATAIDIDAELVTANTAHFARVDGLRVAGYR
jgi:tRNA(fMet)-specific endonuclease VapC